MRGDYKNDVERSKDGNSKGGDTKTKMEEGTVRGRTVVLFMFKQ